MKRNKKKTGNRYQNHYNDNLVKILTSDSIFSDVMLGKNHWSTAYKAKSYKNLDRKSDNYLVYCSSCNRVWENHYIYNPTVYHDSIPTYGKKRIECKRCMEENKNGQND